MDDCRCQSEGWCERFGRYMFGREHEICSGKCPPERPCPPEDVRAFTLATWAQSWGAPVEGGAKAIQAFRQPTLRQRLASYVEALRRWRKAGKPRRTPEQIAVLRATCHACPYWNDGCTICGCSDNQWLRGVLGMAKKMKMATEPCSDKKNGNDRWRAALNVPVRIVNGIEVYP
jgi:hypothetical protein